MLLSLFCLEPGLPQVFTMGAELCQVGSGKGGIPQVAGRFLPQGGGKMGLGPSERFKTSRDLGREWRSVDFSGVVVEEVFSVHGVPLPRGGRAVGDSRESRAHQHQNVISPDRVDHPENTVRAASGQKAINIRECNIEVRSNTVPNAHSGGDDFGHGEGSEGRPVRLVNRGVVAPWNYNST